MNDKFIDLNRHFASIPAELKLRDDAEPVIGATTSVHWVDLLGSHRVVILAEPGAGKTWEIGHAAERLRAEGKAAFFLRLEHVATDLTLAFDVGTHAEFVSWLNGRDEGWIFLDSVDEARLADPRDFDLALRRFGDAINGQGQRAHIYITSRLHEWRWVSPTNALRLVSARIGHDISGFPLDGPVPDLPLTQNSQSFARTLLSMARRQNMTLRDLYNITAAARGHWVIWGTPTRIADTLQEWFEAGLADGFMIQPAYFPGAFDDFVDLVVPELQRRGLFRQEYAGATLRDHLRQSAG
jgi:hypothetical protein